MMLNQEMLMDAHTPHILVPKVLGSVCKASLPCSFWSHSPEDQQPGVVRGG